MILLTKLLHLISQQRAPTLVLLTVLALALTHPLLVRAEPLMRDRSQLAELAQITATPQEEGAGDDNGDGNGDGEEGATPTATPEIETPDPNQSNIGVPEAGPTDIFAVEIPIDGTSTGAPSAGDSIDISFAWQGETTIAAQDLAEAAAPFQAEILQGAFEVRLIPASETSDNISGEALRILPDPSTNLLGTLRLGIKLAPTDSIFPFPAGQSVRLSFSARSYGPDATARLVIADDQGSSSTVIEGLNWTEYQVTRVIDANTTQVEFFLEWANVPANGWLEMSAFNFSPLDATAAATLSPTDTPSLIEPITIPATPIPQPPTSIPEAIALATATPLPTAVPATAAAEEPATEAAQEEAPPEEAPLEEAPLEEAALEEAIEPEPTYIIVTSTPTPVDVFEEATRVAQATDWAPILGTVTATPPNLATPTPTNTPFVVVVVNTPTPANAATAEQVALIATAVAFTTGTPTPYPPEAAVLVATETSPPNTPTPRPTATSTPIFVLLDAIPTAPPAAPVVIPEVLYNKIIFMTAFRGNPRSPNAMIINPDGTEPALMTTNTFYYAADTRDRFSSDRRFFVFAIPEAGGEAHNAGMFQVFYDDTLYSSWRHQLTYFGAGVAWSPTWSPTSETIALVSSESGNDEIWVVNRNEWPPTQLTKNDWEWDHHPSFSPDGSQIVFTSNRVTGTRQLWMMSSSGENPHQITNFPFEAWNPIWIKYVNGQ